MSEALKLVGVIKTFKQGEGELHILRGIDLTLRAGEMVALVGPSGSGKSTLLHITGLLESPTSGQVFIGGEDCSKMNDGARTALRRRTIGFVYQNHHLLPEFSALENVIVPQMIAGRSRKDARLRAQDLLTSVGLGERLEHRPGRLSGGEQQRVAIARALANGPKVVLADEPTGNLDPHTADGVFAMLGQLVKGTGTAALIATHNMELAKRMDRVLRLEAGKLIAG